MYGTGAPSVVVFDTTPASSFLSLLCLQHMMSFTRAPEHDQATTVEHSGAGAETAAAQEPAEEQPSASYLAGWFGLRANKQRSEDEAATSREERFNADPLLPHSPIRTQSQAKRFQEEASKQDAAAAHGEVPETSAKARKKAKKQKAALKKAARDRAAAEAAQNAALESGQVPSGPLGEQQQRPSSSCSLASRISPRMTDLLNSSSAAPSPTASPRRLSVTSHHTALSHAPSLSSERSGKSLRKRKPRPRKNLDAPSSPAPKSAKGKAAEKAVSLASDGAQKQQQASVERWVEASSYAASDARPSTPPPVSMPSIESEYSMSQSISEL